MLHIDENQIWIRLNHPGPTQRNRLLSLQQCIPFYNYFYHIELKRINTEQLVSTRLLLLLCTHCCGSSYRLHSSNWMYLLSSTSESEEAGRSESSFMLTWFQFSSKGLNIYHKVISLLTSASQEISDSLDVVGFQSHQSQPAWTMLMADKNMRYLERFHTLIAWKW